jgi:hypothetical protein
MFCQEWKDWKWMESNFFNLTNKYEDREWLSETIGDALGTVVIINNGTVPIKALFKGT